MSNWTAEDLAAHYQRLTTPPVDTAPAPKPKLKRSEVKEARVERQIIDLLTVHGWLVMRTNKFCGASISSQGAIEPGMPDLQARQAALGAGSLEPFKFFWRILWIEVKRPGGKVSTVQATWHQLAQKRGETVIVAESVDTVAEAIGVTL